ncbi:hypothetical protein GGR57DRAFT_503848 [Xylariaceae sp. FL1272]|nr:hypothetical protein GGR57DRAFT_503848 [Xylariaceae sp. FL1272]
MSNTKTSELPTRVADCLTTWQNEGIQRLQRKLKKFPCEDPTTVLQKVRVNAIRMTYPLRASTLAKLKENLAIQALLLEYNTETFETVAQIVERFGSIENHNEACNQREPGTATWFLVCDEYKDWISGTAQCPHLWLHGNPGCCKTVLASMGIFSRVSDLPNSAIAYFYFSFADARKQTWSNLLLCLVVELSRATNIHPQLLAAYKDGKRPSADILDNVLIDCARSEISRL